MRVRKALLTDAGAIHGLLFEHSRNGALLPRALVDIYENIRDFTVLENTRGILGCGALHFYGMHLAEVRSIAVWTRLKGRGLGRRIVRALLREAHQHRILCVCLFTRTPGFFSKLGFAEVKRGQLPDKVYKDCVNCPRLNDCDEIAMIRGKLPDLSRLEPRRPRRKRRRSKEPRR